MAAPFTSDKPPSAIPCKADVTVTSPSDWKYVSEGGATIVFSYAGPSNPQFDGTVLRLRKCPAPMLHRASSIQDAVIQEEPAPITPQDPTSPAIITAEELEEPDDPMIEYQARCMERLIPKVHLPRMESVRVERGWLQRLRDLKDGERPPERRAKDQIDVTRRKGVLATDLVGGDTIAVEIKPKWAFLPSPKHLSEATRGIKTRTCRFCMHAHMKRMQGEKVSNGYCPLDLFSGNKARVRHAILTLWDAWVESNATVNNLKIFVHGKTIRPNEQDKIFAPGAHGDAREAFADAILPLLTETPVLRTLSKLQRTLDVLDIEGLSRLWQYTEMMAPAYRTQFAQFFVPPEDEEDYNPPTSPLGVSSQYLQEPEPTIDDWSSFLDTYLSPFIQIDHAAPVPEDLRFYLLAYLLSATFKDCSIIVRMDLLGGEQQPAPVDPSRVTVIDLDPKSMKRLRKWEKLDQEIVEAYANVKDFRTCVDEGM
uniref:Inositol-pentakisphosphate 2-kinase n=1 Tax=Schizophyllum commune (strain H4-8 / FGSC 9210) TaxID=578458 RepID=D8PUZ6_SCHCM